MVSLSDRLRAALTEARKARDPARTVLLSTILADLQNREIELQRAASDDEAIEVLRRGVKRRREAAEQFGPAGRADLAERELGQIAMLEEFLPAAVPPEEIRALVRAAIAAGAEDLGQVMGRVMPQLKGRAEGRVINQIAREELSAGV